MLNDGTSDDEFVGGRFLDKKSQCGLYYVGIPLPNQGMLVAIRELKSVVACLIGCQRRLHRHDPR